MRTIKTSAGRLIERVLPKADAQASCLAAANCWVEYSTVHHKCKKCCLYGNCSVQCGGYYYC